MTNDRTPTSTPARKAVVAGAGIAGLATALRLHRSGWQVLVVERSPVRRTGGYMVNLLGRGYDAADELGLLPDLRDRDLGLFTSILVTADGRRKFAVPAAFAQAALGPRALTVFRGDLESVLYAAAREVADIRFGTTVRAVEQDSAEVRIELSDGTSERADLLVGADGVHSGVRDAVFGPESRFRVDLRHMVGAFPLTRVPREIPENSGTTFIGPRRTAAVINLGPGRSSAFFTYRAADPAAEIAAGPVSALTAAFGDVGGGVPDALGRLAQAPEAAYFDSVSQVVADSWSRGRVVLLGDAAWCVSLFAGHGAALALAGAGELGTALDEHAGDIPAALTHWEARLRPETAKRQALARRGMSQYAPPTRAHIRARDLMMRAITLPVIRGLAERSLQRANR
ncbi:FAD-dependent monooxygenase [Nocardia sp. NPDC003345]